MRHASKIRAAVCSMIAMSTFACSSNAGPVGELPQPKVDLPAAKPGEARSAVFAGGCFWTMEGTFEHVKGVTGVKSGYAGGTKETAFYDQTCSGKTDHAESIRVEYDASQITYGELLRIYFDLHDPTTLDRQGYDSGREYRSVIFVQDDEQKKVAEAYLEQLKASKTFKAPVVTAIEDLRNSGFYPAEDYHQNYVQLHPNEGYVRAHMPEKLATLKERHAAYFRDDVAKK